jgi:hypothetical protein
MATKIVRLLITGISHAGLLDAAQKNLGVVRKLFAVDHPQVGPVAGQVQNDYSELQKAMSRKSCSEYTEDINVAHVRCFNDLIALRYLLRLQEKQGMNPEAARSAREVKGALVNSGLWKYTNLSHQAMSGFIVNSIAVLSLPENSGKLTTMGATDAFNALVASRKDCEALEAQRLEEQAGDTTQRIESARQNLFQSMNTLLGVVALGAKNDPAAFGAAAEQVDEVVREANAVTRSGQTRKANAAEAEQAEAHNGGQAQNAANPLQGSPATSVTPETNPVGPPAGKGASTA